MKKFLTIFVLLIASLTLVSCTEEKPDNPVEPDLPSGNNQTDSDKYSDEEYKEMFEAIERYIRNMVKSTTNKNLKFKDTYSTTGAKITYVSSRPDLITNEGKYIKHEYDEEVIITCNVEWEGRTHSFDMNVLAIGIDDTLKLAKVKAWVEDFLENTKLTEGTVLPTTHPDYGGRIRWVCEQPDVIVDYKTINLPVTSGTYRLIAEYTFNAPNAYEIVKYPVVLEATKLSLEDRTINFLKQSLVTTQGDFFNLYEGSSPSIDRSLIVNTDDKLAKKQFYEERPALSQEFLNKEFYEGYQVKNDKEILWIVVHESGMARSGQDALYLAKVQHDYAYNGVDRDASWNYQVDDGAIYQSYEDDVWCWHASTKRGNYRSIGIEMCVNTDGQFNAAMRNDARLIAYFLRTYNLGMINVKQHFDFDSNGKNCPENIRNDKRWFEMMGMITREYSSQTLLQNVDISYNILTEGVTEWKLPGIYRLGENKTINVQVTVFGQTFTINTTNE